MRLGSLGAYFLVKETNMIIKTDKPINENDPVANALYYLADVLEEKEFSIKVRGIGSFKREVSLLTEALNEITVKIEKLKPKKKKIVNNPWGRKGKPKKSLFDTLFK